MSPGDRQKGFRSQASLGSNSALALPSHLTQGTSCYPSELSPLICEVGDHFWKASPDGFDRTKQTKGLAWGRQACRGSDHSAALPGEHSPPVGLHAGLLPFPSLL